MQQHWTERDASALARGAAKSTDIEQARLELARVERVAARLMHRTARRLERESERLLPRPLAGRAV